MTDIVSTNADAIAAQAIAEQNDEFKSTRLETPIIKVTQGTTREVTDGTVVPGVFYNTLTSENLGKTIQFIVAYHYEGRAARDAATGRYFTAQGDTIPPWWGELPLPKEMGGGTMEQWIGTRFDEHPEGEEMFKNAVNNKEREWGHGPLISTTYVYTGLLVTEDPETGEQELQPARITFARTTKKAADKINTVYRSLGRNKPFWDVVFELSTEKSPKGPHHIVKAALAGKATDEQRQVAAELYMAVKSGRVVDNAEAAETEKPAADVEADAVEDGALGVV